MLMCIWGPVDDAVADDVDGNGDNSEGYQARQLRNSIRLLQLLSDIPELDGTSAGVLQNDCATTGIGSTWGDCEDLISTLGCRWCARLIQAGGSLDDCKSSGSIPPNCPALVDPVDVRLCELGIRLDGDISDALANGATGLTDQIGDQNSVDPLPRGDAEQPRRRNEPNGFNIRKTLLMFFPDTDGMPGPEHDNSFLYLAWDISDSIVGCTPDTPPVPFDSDDNARACDVQGPGGVCVDLPDPGDDSADERYSVDFQLCTDLEKYDPTVFSPNGIFVDNDVTVLAVIRPPTVPLHLRASPNAFFGIGGGSDIEMFPTAEFASSTPAHNAVANPSNGCIDREQRICARREDPNSHRNNLEIIIKRVESKTGAFGNDPELIRFSLAQLLALATGASAGDGPDEERASIALRTLFPRLEVTKEVKCADADDGAFSSHATVLPGVEVEYRVTVRNTGNTSLDLSIHDVLAAVGTPGLAECVPLCGSLEATLIHQGVPIDLAGVDVSTVGLGLSPGLFVDNCLTPDEGFLAAVRDGIPIDIGTLGGAVVTRDPSQPEGMRCNVEQGDTLTLRWRALPAVQENSGVCADPVQVDCANSVTVSGRYDAPPAITLDMACVESIFNECDDGLYCNGVESCDGNTLKCVAGSPPCGALGNCDELTDTCGLPVVDVATLVDTFEEEGAGADDNVATVNILCPAVACDETICADVDTDGLCDFAYAATNSLQLACDVNDQFPIALDYTFTAANDGEVDFTSTEICKPGFVADAITAGITVTDCDLCTGDCDGVDDDCAITAALGTNGPPQTVTCRLIIPNRDAWLAFAASDSSGPNCHSNGVAVTAFLDTTGVCAAGVEPIAESACAAEVCINPPCHLDVTKSIRCVEGCDERNATDADTSALEALPGATVEFEVVATNSGTNGDPSICLLEFTDDLDGPFIPCPDFCTVGVVRAGVESVCTLPPDWLPIDGGPVALDLGAACGGALEPGDQVVVRCAGTIPIDAGTEEMIVNTVSVRGAAECPADGPVYCCEDADDAAVDIDTCGLTVDKRATCDDPGAVIDPDLVQSLPGATVGFTFDVCNTGDTPLTTVELADALTCASWFVPGSVAAFVGATDVTDCICTNGPCQTIGDMNGLRDLTGCPPGGIPAGECLTITFQVEVPDDFNVIGGPLDCENTIVVGGFSDICAAPGGEPCAEDSDSAGIDVVVPDFACEKEVCADINNDGDCEDAGTIGIPADIGYSVFITMPCDVNDAFPIRLIYALTAHNPGETALVNAQACDDDLVANAVAAGAEVGPCALCDGPSPCNGIGDTCADLGTILAGDSATVFCEIVFPNPQSWVNFAALDGGDEDCHTNSLDVTAFVDTSGMCIEGADVEVTSSCGAEACLSPPCDLDVSKALRCIESCDDRTPTGADTNGLHVLPGATVEFEIAAANAGSDGTICALEFSDTLTGAFNPCPGTCIVQVINGAGDPFCDVPSDWLPLDGTPVELDLMSSCGVLLQPGDRVVVRCAGTVTGDIDNSVRVAGAAECAGEPVYCCEADSNAMVVVDTCDYIVAKDVTCDDLRAPGAMFDPDLVEALPGSTIGFRIQLANTGTVSLPRVNIGETMDCVDWYVPGSVVADIDDTDVTACICATDNCPTFAELSGDKDFSTCPPGAVPPGGTLTITFKVKVPEDFNTPGVPIDCTNTVTIQGESDVCADATTNACDEVTDDASVDVRVPEIECEETICADLNADLLCDVEYAATNSLQLACDVDFPATLIYAFEIANPGEVPYADADACKPDFVRRAVDAGIIVGPCDLCDAGGCDGTDDDCAEPGPIPAGGSATLTCVLSVPSFGVWTAFAGGSCDANETLLTSHMDTTGLCSAGASVEKVSTCGAQACVDPPCTLEVEKTFRCIEGCDDRTAVGGDTDLLEAIPGAAVEFEIRARNNGAGGDPDICALRFVDTLVGPLDRCVDFCTVGVIRADIETECLPIALPIDGTPVEVFLETACGTGLAPGDTFVVRCAGTIPADGIGAVINTVRVDGAAQCPPTASPVYCCDDTDAAAVDIDTCGLDVSKDVTCDDPRAPDAVFDPDIVDALPGSTIGFRVQVCNTGDVSLTEVELTDTLDCGWPIIAGSVIADVDGADVTGCICTNGACATIDDLNGPRDLTACTPIATNGCLTITFAVQTPADFDTPGTPLDCKNAVVVAGFTDMCDDGSPTGCAQDIDTAGVNLLVPDVTCDKEVCADINNDGDCVDAGTPTIPADIDFGSSVSMACDVNDAFPIRLIYRITVDNPGETDLASAQACDPSLVACAVAAGAIVGPCDLCDDPAPCDGIGDDCADVGPLPPGGSATILCEIEFPTPQSWVDFAACDGGDENCHTNGVEVTAEVNTTGLCADGADLELVSSCGAQACLSPPCDLEVSKTFHCIESCDDRTPTGADTNALPILSGMAVEFEVTIANAGDPNDPDPQSICSLRVSDTLNGPFTPCTMGGEACVVEVFSDSGSRECPLPGGVLPFDGSPVELDLTGVCGPPLEPGDRVVIRCAGIVDGQDGDIASNAVVVEGATVCAPGEDIVYCCKADLNAIVEVNTCAFTVQKDVACDDGAFMDSVNVLPGGSARFRIQVCNTGSLPLPILEINESLSCATWFVPSSVEAFIDGTDVTDCICPQGGCDAVTDLNGSKFLDDCVPGGIPTNGCLTITFDIEVPPDYAVDDLPLDCTNAVTVGALTEVCASGTPDTGCGGLANDDATIDVQPSAFACAKTVAADYLNDGTENEAATDDLQILEANPFPIRLTYRFEVDNQGGAPLTNVQVCDANLVADALAAGATINPAMCALCSGPCDGVDDTCTVLGDIDAGSTGFVTCDIVLQTEAQYATFAARDDGDSAEYVNEMTATADVDTNALCGTPPILDSQVCSARIAFTVAPPLPPVCFPLTKASFTTWNENEVKFTGLDRCILLWDQTPFSLYGEQLLAPNHLLVQNLHTTKGKAQINGLQSQLCAEDDLGLESVAAPLVGVAHKLLYFNGTPQALAGMELTGIGLEEGYIRYDLGIPGGEERPEGPAGADRLIAEGASAGVFGADPTYGGQPLDGAEAGDDGLLAAAPPPPGAPRGVTSQKGSLLVFPKVELRWRQDPSGNWELAQDTFIELTNDYPADVWVQMYFVHGDRPLAYDPDTGERAHPGCNWLDVQIGLTASEPTYWSAYSGNPKGVSPWSILDPGAPPGRPAQDGTNDRVLRGYVLAWAVKYVNVGGHIEQHEIAWNHLAGAVTIVNYALGEAWSHAPWAFQTVSAPHGTEPDFQPGVIRLNGVEYEAVPDMLLLDFYATGSTAFSRPPVGITVDSDLTLLPLLQDLRQR